MTAIGTRKLKITIDDVQYNPEVSAATVTAADGESDFVPFAAADTGGLKDFFLNLTLAQDMASGSLWRKIWDNAGTDVPVIVAPYGNATPSATQPHMEGIATIALPDGTVLGGESNKSSTAKFTIEVQWAFLEKPDLVES